MLKFSSQQPSPGRSGVARHVHLEAPQRARRARKTSPGIDIAATRQITFEGDSVSNPERLAVGSYSAAFLG